jgi:hypothetical protein
MKAIACTSPEEASMFRMETETDQDSTTFRLRGDLSGPGVAQLERSWQLAKHSGKHLFRLNLCALSTITDQGKDLLKRMFCEGVAFTVGPHGPATKVE